MSSDDPELEWLAQQALEFDQEVSKKLGYEVADEDPLVVSHPDRLYQAKSSMKKILTAELGTELEGVLAATREINEEMIGFSVLQGKILLETDEAAEEVRVRLRTWLAAFSDHRLKRPNRKDRNSPVWAFRRVLNEMKWFLEVAEATGSVHAALLGEFTPYLAWVLYERTWKNRVRFKRDLFTGRVETKLAYSDREEQTYCARMLHLQHWLMEQDLELFLRELVEAGIQPEAKPDDIGEEQLGNLADDLREMRPLLWSVSWEKTLIELGPFIVGWYWNVGHRIGNLVVAPSRRQVIEFQHSAQAPVQLAVLNDGLLGVSRLPWLTAVTGSEQIPNALAFNVDILRRIRDMLLLHYEKIDFAAIQRGIHEQAQKDAQLSDEEFVASCRALVEAPGDAGGDESAGTSRRRIPAVRLPRLLNVLGDQLGCEVRQGKGSEVVIFRQGGHHFRLGRHKRSTHVPSFLIRNLLKAVGISDSEWIRATE